MFKDRLDYIRTLFAPESAALRATRENLTDPNDQISIYPEEGKLLQLLIRLGGIRSIIEIGTLGGYSTRWMADALPEDGKITTIEKDPARAKAARQHLPEKATLIEGNAVEVLKTMDTTFDMAFIDADKLNYLHYLDWAEQHVRKGGLIVGDNTLLFDAVWMQETPPRVRETALAAMRAFNLRLAQPEKYLSIMLPTHEGMTIAIKNF